MIFYIIAALMIGWAVFYLARSVKKKDCGCGKTDCPYKDKCGECRDNEKP
jgi:hypothetical protein